MCETLGAPCWMCRLENAEEALVGLVRDSGLSAGVYGAFCSASEGIPSGRVRTMDELMWEARTSGIPERDVKPEICSPGD